jgi:hypothetical protein
LSRVAAPRVEAVAKVYQKVYPVKFCRVSKKTEKFSRRDEMELVGKKVNVFKDLKNKDVLFRGTFVSFILTYVELENSNNRFPGSI